MSPDLSRARTRALLAPAELSKALAVYREAGTYAAAARAVDRDESTVRKALRRHTAPERHSLMADALDAAHRDALDAVGAARERLLEALAHTADPRDVALIAHTLNDSLRSIGNARLAHARLAEPEAFETDETTDAHERLAAKLERLVREPPFTLYLPVETEPATG